MKVKQILVNSLLDLTPAFFTVAAIALVSYIVDEVWGLEGDLVIGVAAVVGGLLGAAAGLGTIFIMEKKNVRSR